ncbi:MAG: class I SAM-dependent RNA methyltransferase [Chitinispirillia bacterium]|nr:class I SAM-dependent RNA methyltransferase [Chitinispirillia bacterium]MCL2268085.1 class I SAM-dependent RNA methyltransferase [Chitinispirillia bacterium]
MSTVRIEKLVFGGYGLGRDDDGVVLIPGVAPGEVVGYEEDGAQGGTRVGRAVRIIEKSPHRREPPCRHYGECGGCDWLYLSYDEQVRCKKEIFLDCVDRIGKFPRLDDVEVLTAEEFGYRIRAQIKIDRQNNHAGFFKRKTNDVVKIKRCPLLADGINDVLEALNAGKVGAVSKEAKDLRVLMGERVASCPCVGGLTSADTEIVVGDIRFLADGGSFFQSNQFLLEALGRWARGDTGGEYCLDLYGGIGFFSLMLADDFSKIVLVENVRAQVQAAERNFRHNGKDHLKAVPADVEKGGYLDKLIKPKRPDCIIVDPPRPGLVKSVRRWLIDTAPETILYVSCNPSTFARDAGALINGGYELSRWALFDLYPNTHHMESAAIFCLG